MKEKDPVALFRQHVVVELLKTIFPEISKKDLEYKELKGYAWDACRQADALIETMVERRNPIY